MYCTWGGGKGGKVVGEGKDLGGEGMVSVVMDGRSVIRGPINQNILV